MKISCHVSFSVRSDNTEGELDWTNSTGYREVMRIPRSMSMKVLVRGGNTLILSLILPVLDIIKIGANTLTLKL